MKSDADLPAGSGYSRAYSESFCLAFQDLAKSDLTEICRRTGGKRLSEHQISLIFLGENVTVDIARQIVLSSNNPLSMPDQLVMLHYLVTSDESEPSGRLISFKELNEGTPYYPTFYNRAIAPIVKQFGDSPGTLITASISVGGQAVSLGDAGISIQILPKIKLYWVLWHGDSDFPAEGALLFDEHISKYLPVEDIAVLGQSIALKLCRSCQCNLDNEHRGAI